MIHRIYRDKEWEGFAEDHEFSPRILHEHWAGGPADIERILQHRSWPELRPHGAGFVTDGVRRTG